MCDVGKNLPIKKGGDQEGEELMLSNCGATETLESPLDSEETKPVDPKGNQP